MGYFEGRRISQEVIDKIKGNETINLNFPIGSLEGRRQLSKYGLSERQKEEGSRKMAFGEFEAS